MPNRTLCDVLKEARTCYETRNFSYLPALLEEAQMMGNRMESALYDQHDLRYAEKQLKKVNKKLEEQKDKLDLKEPEDEI